MFTKTYKIVFRNITQDIWDRTLVNGYPNITRKNLGTAECKVPISGLFLDSRHDEIINMTWNRVCKRCGWEGKSVHYQDCEIMRMF